MAEETAEPAVSNETVAAPAGDTEGTVVEQPQQQTEGADVADETPVVELNEEQKVSWSKLPPEIRKHANKLFTQKTQDIAAERQSLSQAKQLAQALTDQPDLTIEMLARQRGFQITKPQAQPPSAQEQAVKDAHLQALEEQFGPQAAQAIVGVAERLAEAKAEARVKPLADFHNQSVQERERQDAASAEEALGKEFPDYKQYVPQMQQIAQNLKPGPGMTKKEFARILYLAANPNRTSAQTTNAVVKKLTESAKAAQAPAQPVSTNRVATSLPAYKTFNEGFQAAYESAKRGEQ